jgi:hypothetical protein
MRRLLPPLLRRWLRARSLRFAQSLSEFDATRYWEGRYSAGGTSGEGSYGRLADFKARVINDFMAEHGAQSVIEFGCGDGNQLSLLNAPRYTGFDISRTAVQRCIDRFRSDRTKNFFLFDGASYCDAMGVFTADVVLSLDVIYHLVADAEFESYMSHLCSACRKHLILYTTDYDSAESGHQRHRAISVWMQGRPEYALVRTIPNPYAGSADGENRSDAKFLIYERVHS